MRGRANRSLGHLAPHRHLFSDSRLGAVRKVCAMKVRPRTRFMSSLGRLSVALLGAIFLAATMFVVVTPRSVAAACATFYEWFTEGFDGVTAPNLPDCW